MFNQVLMLARVTAAVATLAATLLRLARLAATRAALRLAAALGGATLAAALLRLAGLVAATALIRVTTRHAAGAAAANLLFHFCCIYVFHLLYFYQRLFFTQTGSIRTHSTRSSLSAHASKIAKSTPRKCGIRFGRY